MDQAMMERSGKADQHEEHDVAVAVITPVGTYPDDDDFRRIAEMTVIAKVLEEAAKKLKLTNTADWVAHVEGREINAARSFKDDNLCGIVEIEWHKREGGGGA
jgi:hypothetical protein